MRRKWVGVTLLFTFASSFVGYNLGVYNNYLPVVRIKLETFICYSYIERFVYMSIGSGIKSSSQNYSRL
jgi:hypothetical protein